ncbi:MAG: hypothetical protein IJ150_12995 [Bacteroidales bacterium]|nr:hypothetical protein [Bacteroidales bacterium]
MKQLILILCVVFWLTSCQKDEYEKINNQTVIFIFPYSADMNGYFQKNLNNIETAMKNGAFFNERIIIILSPSKEQTNAIEIKKTNEILSFLMIT